MSFTPIGGIASGQKRALACHRWLPQEQDVCNLHHARSRPTRRYIRGGYAAVIAGETRIEADSHAKVSRRTRGAGDARPVVLPLFSDSRRRTLYVTAFECNQQEKTSGLLLVALHLMPGIIFAGFFWVLSWMLIRRGLTA
jgi:hypothetical protein